MAAIFGWIGFALGRVAGVASQWDAQQELDAQAFAKQLSNKLMDMVSRVKNIQVLF